MYTLLGADAETLAILTDGICVRGRYHFEALEVKGLDRRTDGVLLPDAPEEPIWVIEGRKWGRTTFL
ncbi:Rpn family recombination-promoting nuclease/putative transposase [Thiohalocapsa sp. ML1]|uniref:Rpn family recombination-promoting nuclease/putative transposase n=1 Tax=Thiohalocapsa sp. ML1 TaxID=1431688 RepID=UPI00210F3DB3|nr:Rpn family recombination-promoting nuclease/putative transposase [Thiohalocapsa sp. ML1]